MRHPHFRQESAGYSGIFLGVDLLTKLCSWEWRKLKEQWSHINLCTIAWRLQVFSALMLSLYQVTLIEKEKVQYTLWYRPAHTFLSSPQPNAKLTIYKMPFLNVMCLNCICSFPMSTTPLSQELIWLCSRLLNVLTFQKWISCFLAEFYGSRWCREKSCSCSLGTGV